MDAVLGDLRRIASAEFAKIDCCLMRVELSRSAERDLRDIHAYIAADDPAAADKVVGRLIKSLLLLRANPAIGRASASGDYREWSVPSLPYVIPFKIRSDIIYIVRIYHTRRLKPDDWQ
jgi:plasmid stabilization system protein ParE